MKKSFLILALLLGTTFFASAQLIPSLSFGLKGGINMSNLSFTGSDFSGSNRAGYLGGVYLRAGGLGFNFQPELYVTGKNVTVENNGIKNDVSFTSIDVPVLFGGKVGAFGLGGRFYTGPLASFTINKDQSAGQAVANAATLSNVKDQNFAWQFGAGLDIKKLSIDLRYEYGLTKQSYSTPEPNATSDKTRINLFNISLSYQLFSL